jgi:single-strand DNA-binding protein
MNSVQLLGNLARDPEIRFTKTGRAMARFTVACTNTYIPYGAQEPREITDFVPCVAWGNLAETCGNNLAKGSRVFVEGRYSTRSYETPDGQKRYVTEVVANFVAQTMGSEHQGNGPAARRMAHRRQARSSRRQLHRELALTAWAPALPMTISRSKVKHIPYYILIRRIYNEKRSLEKTEKKSMQLLRRSC